MMEYQYIIGGRDSAGPRVKQSLFLTAQPTDHILWDSCMVHIGDDTASLSESTEEVVERTACSESSTATISVFLINNFQIA